MTVGGSESKDQRSRQFMSQHSHLVAATKAPSADVSIIGLSVGAQRRRVFVSTMSDHYGPILLSGERGVGKETLARSLHYESRRASFPFICLDTSRLTGGYLTNLLFGSVEQAPRTKSIIRRGVAELAGAGTIYVGEISRFSHDEQHRLLEVAVAQRFHRNGESQSRRTEIRLILGSQYGREELGKNELVLPELLTMVADACLFFEPLRERREDIPLFIERFSNEAVGRDRRGLVGFTVEALDALTHHGWPGNVAELRETVEEAMFKQHTHRVDLGQLPTLLGAPYSSLAAVKPSQGEFDFYQKTAHFQKALIESALCRTAGNQRKASALLNLKETTLSAMIRRLGIERSQVSQ